MSPYVAMSMSRLNTYTSTVLLDLYLYPPLDNSPYGCLFKKLGM